uniref:Eukaryotic translation initiation factor 3 subunit M n=1 Tax=Romanomermis culicivorax TaxID=13658 RepID=A0A915HP80_ROMCU
MMQLVVMDCVPAEQQSRKLREYLSSLGAKNLSEETNPDIDADVAEILPHLDVVAGLPIEQDIEVALNCIVSLLITTSRTEDGALVKQMCQKMESDLFKGHDATLLHILSNLFYGFHHCAKYQFQIYCSMLKIAARSGLVKSMITDLNRLKEWFKMWNLTVEEQRVCLRQLHTALSQGQDADALSKVMFELLSTYTTDADALKAKDDAKQCVKSALNDPDTYIFDHLLNLKPVQSLSKNKDLTYQLLEIFVSGSLRDYSSFYHKNKVFIESEMKLSHEILTQKMRVLTLISLCENKTEVNLNDVSTAINLSVGEQLDEFIIKAVQSRAIRAKIDQVQGRLIVGGVKNRRFTDAHWEQLRSKLDHWSHSLKQVKKYMESIVVEN